MASWWEGRFNTIVSKTGTRMWGASKELTVVMRKPEINSDVIWDTVELLSNGAYFVIWSREDGTHFPNLNEEPDPDDLCPEETIIKQFWKNKYAGINQWRNESHYQ